jgi:predicted DNA-binding helix-hairpin-helix protein
MLLQDKLSVLTSSARFDVCGYEGNPNADRSPLRFLYNASLPKGGSICLFKVLQTNVCVNDCAYCINQVGRDCPRYSLPPEELAKTFMELNSRRIAHGLILSSAISGNASRTMESMTFSP